MMTDEIAVRSSDLRKTYFVGETQIEVLKGVDLQVVKDDFITISGPSGSGKTTLLNIIASIDKPTDGKIFVLDEDLCAKDEDFLADFRCKNVGFVFQSYNLVPTLTVAENVAFPMEWLRKPKDQIEKHVSELLETVGLAHRGQHFPFQLSGGEQQRVAFARAMANEPCLFLADEPTGNLDKKTSSRICRIFEMLKESGKTVIVTTHDEEIIELADGHLRLEDGKLMT